ncbi:MAG: penicillin acylase family protein [Chromatiales bacterium]|nr:penicillin acylase family protein [Chromatiales bacterium]
MKRIRQIVRAGLGALSLSLTLASAGVHAAALVLPGLNGPASLDTDAAGQPVITATNDADACFVLGWSHASNRLYQMDVLRRAASGTLAELLGSAVLEQDVQLRTLGLRRAAERSETVLSATDLACLQAYAAAINTLIAVAPQLPPEYGALELTKAGIPAWTPTDTLAIVKLLTFQLGVSLVDIDRTIALLTLQGVGAATGFDGAAAFFEELWRAAPFESAPTIPDYFDDMGKAPTPLAAAAIEQGKLLAQLKQFRSQVDSNPLLQAALRPTSSSMGSNMMLVAGALTESGYPMFANDPHQPLENPSLFFPIASLDVTDAQTPYWVSGVSFPGVPGFGQGCTASYCWGSTVNRVDQTDVFQLKLQIDPQAGVPVAYFVENMPRPLQLIPQTYKVNLIKNTVFDDVVDSGITPQDPGGLTLIAPDFGPIVNVDFSDPTNVTALAVASVIQFATQEFHFFRQLPFVNSPQNFRAALEYFDVGSQNWGYADNAGNIAYFTMAEIPLRTDLQMDKVAGLGPGFIRNGNDPMTHWAALANPQPNQATPFEILPYDELPNEINPTRGYIINANSDPVGTTADNNPLNQWRAGGGIYYLNEGSTYYGGYRQVRMATRIAEVVENDQRKFTLDDMISIQGETKLHDASVFVPYIVQALVNAQRPEAELPLKALLLVPNLVAAVQRLAAWDFSTPTGTDDGFDFGDNPAQPGPPSDAEIANSVAATLYSGWRDFIVRGTFDLLFGTLETFTKVDGLADDVLPEPESRIRALRHVLENFDAFKGGSASKLFYFFGTPGINSVADARDFVILLAMKNALDQFASPAFDGAFGQSKNLDDYRWGMLHRIVFKHTLGDFEPLLNVPPGANTVDALQGFAVDGGTLSIDLATSDRLRADTPADYQFNMGPARRFVAHLVPPEMGPIQAQQITPLGASGIPNPADPFYANQTPLWLTNRFLPLPTGKPDPAGLIAGDEFLPLVP